MWDVICFQSKSTIPLRDKFFDWFLKRHTGPVLQGRMQGTSKTFYNVSLIICKKFKPVVKSSNVKSFQGFHVRVSKTTGQNCAKGNIFVTCEKSEQKTIPTG